MRLTNFVYGFAFSLALASVCSAQSAPADPQGAAPTPPAPLSQPAITGPLSGLPPATFDAGPFGKISANGFLSGGGMVQGNHITGDKSAEADLSNGQIVIQKADGPVQFYLQAGA